MVPKICRDLSALACHDHATLYSTSASFIRLSLISSLDLELILSRKKNPRRVPPSSDSTGKYRQKSVKDLVTENLKRKWDVSQPFFFYSRVP